MNLFKVTWDLLNKKQKSLFFILVIFSIFQTIFEMIGIAAAIPFVTFLLQPDKLSEIAFISNFKIFNEIEMTDNLLFYLCLAFFSIFMIKNLIIIITNKLIFNFIFDFRLKLFKSLIDKILHQEYIFFIRKGISQIFNTTLNEVNMYTTNVIKPLIILLSEVLVSFGILILIILTGNLQGLVLILPVILIVGLILKKINEFIKSWSITRIEENEKLISYNLNLINGIKDILIFGNIKNILSRFDKSLKSLMDVDVKNNVVGIYPKILLEQSVILIFILLILLLNYLNTSSKDLIIILSFYLVAAYRLVPSITRIFFSYQLIKSGMPSIPKVMEYYNLPKKNIFFENKETSNSLKFDQNIELKNVSFEYEHDNKVIENLNLTIHKNEIIGILGDSGVGKSTFINILTNLLKPKSGNIIIDDKELNDPIELRKYQNLFSISSQDTYLIDGTIRDNIIFGSNKKISEERINEAIKFSRLEKMIKNLPKGLESFIGSTIKQLSSGQKQRISIARLFYSDREIFIFDEATNALDENNEKFIIDNIKELKQKKTIIIISHNKENLRNCDKIFELKNKTLQKI